MARRDLNLPTLSDAVAECELLLESGYTRNGNWSLAQACRHLRLTVDASIDGYPRWTVIGYPIRPLMRWLMLPKLLRGDSPSGLSTLPMFVPPDDLSDAEEVAAFIACVSRFKNHSGYLHPHPGFGKFDQKGLDQFHAAHVAHHLSFLTGG